MKPWNILAMLTRRDLLLSIASASESSLYSMTFVHLVLCRCYPPETGQRHVWLYSTTSYSTTWMQIQYTDYFKAFHGWCITLYSLFEAMVGSFKPALTEAHNQQWDRQAPVPFLIHDFFQLVRSTQQHSNKLAFICSPPWEAAVKSFLPYPGVERRCESIFGSSIVLIVRCHSATSRAHQF